MPAATMAHSGGNLVRFPLVRGYFDRAAVSRRLREARENAGLSRSQLAEILNVSEGAIVGWEDPGRHPLPLQDKETEANINTVAEALGVTVPWLLHGSSLQEEPEPEWAEGLRVEVRELRQLVHDLNSTIRRLRQEPPAGR